MGILQEELTGILYEDYKPENLIIKNIIGKVLIKWNQRVGSDKCDCETGCMIRSGTDKLKPCKNLIKPTFYNDTYKFWTHMNQFNTKSFEHKNEKEDKKDKKKHQPYDKNLTQNKFIRIFPPGGNTNSQNYPFMKYIIDGAQLVALNIQTQDFHTMFQMEFFRNGCLRKKPQWLLNLKPPEYIEYKIFFPKELTNIEIYTDDNDKKIDMSGNNILINVIKELEIIYIECKYDNKEYKGAITLTSDTNTLYNIIEELIESEPYFDVKKITKIFSKKKKEFPKKSAWWFIKKDNTTKDENYNLKNPINLKSTITGTNITITIEK